MFTSISWEIFLTTVVVIAASYYLITALVFYRKEIVARITSRPDPVMPAISDSGIKSNAAKNVMGQANKEPESTNRFSLISADELTVEENTEAPETIAYHVRDPLISSMYDLLAESRTLIQSIVEQKSDANECEELFRSLLLRYPHLKQTDHRDGVAVYIAKASEKQLPFALNVTQVAQWWNEK